MLATRTNSVLRPMRGGFRVAKKNCLKVGSGARLDFRLIGGAPDRCADWLRAVAR